MPKKKQEPVIKIAGMDIPIHLAWQKIEVLNTAADLLENLNNKYPELASEFTCEVSPIVRKRINDSLGEAKKPPQADLKLVELLLDKLAAGEDPLEIVQSVNDEEGVDITLSDLVYLVGDQPYLEAMNRQAKIYQDNQISAEQIAELWNESELPAPGKMHWTDEDVEELLGLN